MIVAIYVDIFLCMINPTYLYLSYTKIHTSIIKCSYPFGWLITPIHQPHFVFSQFHSKPRTLIYLWCVEVPGLLTMINVPHSGHLTMIKTFKYISNKWLEHKWIRNNRKLIYMMILSLYINITDNKAFNRRIAS